MKWKQDNLAFLREAKMHKIGPMIKFLVKLPLVVVLITRRQIITKTQKLLTSYRADVLS